MKPGRWRRKIKPSVFWVIFTLVLGVGAAVILIVNLNARLRPILLELAIAQTSNCITAAVDRAVAEQAVEYSDLVQFERASNGEIIAMTSNMAQANRLRAQLLDVALNSLDGLETLQIGIPIGTILDVDIFSGLGPEIDVRILYTGTASAEFNNSFFSAGINQTCHQIIFSIDADVVVLLPGKQHRTSVSTDVCVAETIIVGKVPDTYLNLKQ